MNNLSPCLPIRKLQKIYTPCANENGEGLKADGKSQSGHVNPTPELTTYGGIKLGWIQGVLIPCLLNIWGVMLFLRISWIVGQAGIFQTIIIIFFASVVCIVTTLSLSAICTNGELEGGGVYFLVSRSLGAELGASVGIIFAFANAVAASMNTIGFCDSLNELLKSHGLKIVDNASNDVRIVGAIALLVMCVICAIGMDWETKTQNFLITVIALAIMNFIIGACYGPMSDSQVAKGFVGISLETAKQNWKPDYRPDDGVDHNFFSIFAMYFPAVTGVQAGANICGDLRNPAAAIPKGTLLALAISITSYLVMAILSGAATLRDASGDQPPGDCELSQSAGVACKPDCQYGLHNNYEVSQLMSLWAPLIYTGCWAATLSTALTNLLSVPRLIQALGADRIYPGLVFFSKRYGRHGEPYRGYVLTYFVSLTFLLIADLNMVAPLITNFYLASYALINFCTFHAGLVGSISWRPTFTKYNKWLSLFGFLMCLVFMMIISWVMALATVFIFITLYLLVLYSKPEASWGSSTETQRYHDTITNILQISHRALSIRTYNPQLLVLAGRAYARPALLDIGSLITKTVSFMIVADIDPIEVTPQERMNRMCLGDDWLVSRKERAFYVVLSGYSRVQGLLALVQCAGLGRLAPNIVLLGYKNKWTVMSHDDTGRYVDLIRVAFKEHQSVAIFRGPESSKPKSRVNPAGARPSVQAVRRSEVVVHSQLLALMHSDSDISLGDHKNASVTRMSTEMSREDGNEQRRKLLRAYKPISFTEDKTIDVWWLYDDGGMSILLPYIIARRGFKDKRMLRIFAIARSAHRTEHARECMESLLAKFRIEYNELTMVEGISNAPTTDSWELLNSLIKPFKTDVSHDNLTSDAEIKRLLAKTCRYMRLRELLLENSNNTSLIVMTLPIPRYGQVSSSLYMAWLEMLSRDLPPMLFVRGNKTTVLDA